MATEETPKGWCRGRKSKLTVEERRALYASMPAKNKYMEAARKTQGHLKIYDPAFMI